MSAVVVLAAAWSHGCATPSEHASPTATSRIYVDDRTSPATAIRDSGIVHQRADVVFVLLQDATFPRVVQTHESIENAGYRFVGELSSMVLGDARCLVGMADPLEVADAVWSDCLAVHGRLWEGGVPCTIRPAGNTFVIYVPRSMQAAAKTILEQFMRHEAERRTAPAPALDAKHLSATDDECGGGAALPSAAHGRDPTSLRR